MYPNLKLQLWRSGIRQNRLALMVGVDETMLSKIINGYRVVSPELRERIAVILQSNEEWLFEPVAEKQDSSGRRTREGGSEMNCSRRLSSE